MMLTIHHLGNSRSERIIWLAEELAIPYTLVRHDRDPQTMRSPASLWAVSPLGKAPVIQDDGVTVSESGAVIEYLLQRYGNGRLQPSVGSAEWVNYLHWMHAAESTLMTPILFNLLSTMMQVSSPQMGGFVASELETLCKYISGQLSAHEYIAGNEFTAADIMVSYTLSLARMVPVPNFSLDAYPAIGAYLDRIQARPAFQRALQVQ
ncbi:MAG TPA: glutathione S-transferase family protein [Spongiibacteraceae bacterium]|nr:glutathione S-transferase family protein [Spongiibacteraceae bacterium]